MDRQKFLETMSEAARNQSDRAYAVEGLWIIAILAILIALIFVVMAIHRRRELWRGYWILWRKRIKGEAISKDRRKEKFEVVIQLPFEQKPFRTRTLNVSPRGFFVFMDPPLMVGESFRFLLILHNDVRINGTAEVRWAREVATPYHPSGMGCKFYHVSDGDERLLKKYLRRSA